MNAIHLPATATAEEVVTALREHGYAIVDDLASQEQMDRLAAEMAPYVDRTGYGDDNFLGKKTRRTGALIRRSPAARELVMNPLVLGTVGRFLEKSSAFQLHLTQIISVYPGSAVQALHRDQLAWDFFPFPKDFEVQCNLLWALTDYTEEMGATRVVPGSHLEDREDYDIAESIPAEMRRGSALFYTGKVIHGAGENRSDKVRQAVNITYAVGWVRQEENQYLSTPLEVAQTLPEDLLRVMGYQTGCFGIGYVGDVEDPMSVIRPDAAIAHNAGVIEKRAQSSESAASFMRAAYEETGS